MNFDFSCVCPDYFGPNLNLAGHFCSNTDKKRKAIAMSDFAPSPSLPQDLITDILLRLPVKSIGQFRCVSKPWRSLLSSPQFIRAHLTFHIHDPEKIILTASSDHSPYILTLTSDRRSSSNDDGVSRKVICPLLQQNKWANVEGSCHGLVLVVNEESCKILINPITLEVVEVPHFCLSLNPFVSFCMCGLGYDSSNDDYKIVTLSYYDTDNEHEPDCAETFVDIYSVKLKTWRRLANSPYDHAVPHIASGVFLNGCLHWLASDTMTEGYPSVIAAFNLAREEFEKLPPPRGVAEEKFVFHELIVLGGCLAMVVDSYQGPIDVWMMKEYGVRDSWTKLTINSPEDGNAYSFKPVCLLRDDEIVLEKDSEQLVAYNLTNGVRRGMVVAGIPDLFEDGVMTFTETLLSPNYIPD